MKPAILDKFVSKNLKILRMGFLGLYKKVHLAKFCFFVKRKQPFEVPSFNLLFFSSAPILHLVGLKPPQKCSELGFIGLSTKNASLSGGFGESV